MAIVGREIYVLAWNFVPISRDGGVLEVIKWSLPDQASKPGNDALSPVFSVPFSVQHGGFQGNARDETGDGAYLEGFIVELSTCKCDSCGKARSVKELHHCLLDQKVHSFDNPVFVYFREPCSSWRPILSKLLGDVVTVSGLKKKYISAGGLESLIFVTTERTIVHENGKPGIAGEHVGNYCGVVTGVFKNGTVVELDRKNVWLLLAGPLLDLPHSLRVGAVVGFYFLALAWIMALLVTSSFQKKFAGVLSEKEILGTKKVSPSSGRLQLVDSTGCVDVVMPDLSPNFDQRILYEVKEGTHNVMIYAHFNARNLRRQYYILKSSKDLRYRTEHIMSVDSAKLGVTNYQSVRQLKITALTPVCLFLFHLSLIDQYPLYRNLLMGVSQVYGTFLLLLEDQVPKPKRLRPAQRFRIPAVRIPLADDGSSLCCCWADSGRAKTMLQLEESACQSFSSGHGDNQTQVTVGYLLKKMLKNHRRITLRNFGAKVDSPLVDATFSVDSRKVLSPFDQDALKFVILHAQNGPNLNVAGHVLNLEELPCLEEDLSATDLVKKSMIHVWATEVTHASSMNELPLL
ncbi:unnamed protein product [Spirodela intermedia]|uniref:CST complex subunit CTC1 n=1 Tax=Spirodela intermedia TaxID=51605 RepID=A0A7I8IT71_SPIIN|nr:unnamed protein product [Spirodela intermedia]CAA6660144.1 unnamed protein product [Spirodela intermedia]